MNEKDTKNYSRLLTIFIYLFMNMPAQVTWTMKSDSPDLWHSGLFWVYILILVYLFLETMEFSVWHYRFPHKRVAGVLLLLRIVLLAAAAYLTEVPMNHVLSISYYSLLFFYTYQVFSFRVSLGIFLFFLMMIVGETLYLKIIRLADYRSDLQTILMYKVPTMLICYFFAHIWTQERNTFDDNRILIRDLNAKEVELKGLLKDIDRTTALKERTRLARDIHDSVGHALMAVQIQLNKAAAYTDIDVDETKMAIDEAGRTAADATRDIRTSLDILNSQERISSVGDAVPRLLRPLRDRGILVSNRIMGSETGYNHMVLLGIYRLIQEGVTNILRHADAKEVKLDIHFGEEYAEASLADDGIGFNPEGGSGKDGHYGLSGLERRLEMAEGQLLIQSQQGKGCALKVRLMKDPVRLAGEYDEQN